MQQNIERVEVVIQKYG